MAKTLIHQNLDEILRDLTSARNRPWILIAIGFAVILAAWKFKLGEPRPALNRRGPDTIEYHYQQWLHERRYLGRRPKGWNLTTLNWYLDGKPTLGERMNAFEEHQEALIRLGYFDERHFDWHGSDLGKFFFKFTQRAAQTDLKGEFRAGWAPNGSSTNVSIIARKQYMPIIESIWNEMTRASTNATTTNRSDGAHPPASN